MVGMWGVTAATARWWSTHSGAMDIHLGVGTRGPAGTGKAEPTEVRAKGLGMLCGVVNCSGQI